MTLTNNHLFIGLVGIFSIAISYAEGYGFGKNEVYSEIEKTALTKGFWQLETKSPQSSEVCIKKIVEPLVINDDKFLYEKKFCKR